MSSDHNKITKFDFPKAKPVFGHAKTWANNSTSEEIFAQKMDLSLELENTANFTLHADIINHININININTSTSSNNPVGGTLQDTFIHS